MSKMVEHVLVDSEELGTSVQLEVVRDPSNPTSAYTIFVKKVETYAVDGEGYTGFMPSHLWKAAVDAMDAKGLLWPAIIETLNQWEPSSHKLTFFQK